MFVNFITYFLLLTMFNYINTDNENETISKKPKEQCREENELITSNKTEKYKLIDVVLDETFILECHYCLENDNNNPKIWYKIDLFNNTPQEVELGMQNNVSLNRVSVSVEHSLTIKEANLDDYGIYFCHDEADVVSDSNFNYIIDIVFRDPNSPESGNLTHWRRYHAENMEPINNLLKHSNGTEFIFARNELKLNLEIITQWETFWSPCEVCGRPQGEGTEEKMGYCRIKLINLDDHERRIDDTDFEMKLNFFLNISQLSCRSILFAELFPEISNMTQIIPHFLQTRQCEGICNPNAEGLNFGWKFSSTKTYKYRKIFVLAQKAHLTIVCPESTLENTVIWRLNGHVLKRGETITNEAGTEPHIIVDTFNTLYLLDVGLEDEGNYSCQVDDIRMQLVRVFVVSKTRLLTKAFLRHMMYLAFVLSLSSVCYCAGLIIAWRRRHTFKGYMEVATDEVFDSACDPECCEVQTNRSLA